MTKRTKPSNVRQRSSSTRGAVVHRHAYVRRSPRGAGRVSSRRINYDTYSGASVVIDNGNRFVIGHVSHVTRLMGAAKTSGVPLAARAGASDETVVIEEVADSMKKSSLSTAARQGARLVRRKSRGIAERVASHRESYEDFVYDTLDSITYQNRMIFDRSLCVTDLEDIVGGDNTLKNSTHLFFDTCDNPTAFRHVVWSCMAYLKIASIIEHFSSTNGVDVVSNIAPLRQEQEKFRSVIVDEVTLHTSAYFARRR